MSPMHRVVHRLLLTVTLLCALVSPAAAQSLDFPQPADFDSDRTLAHAYHLSETIGDRPGGSVGEQVSAGWPGSLRRWATMCAFNHFPSTAMATRLSA